MSEELTTPTPEEQPKKKRRKRRTKAEIAAEKAAKEAAAAEAAEMEAKGYEKVRHRDEHGHFVKDDPSTPENEAWDWVKKEEPEEEELIPYEPVVRDREAEHARTAERVEEECVPCKEEAAAALEAAEAALEKEVEINFGSSYEEEIDAISEETVEPEKPKDPYADYVPMTGLAKLRNRLAQRQRRSDSSKR